MKNEFRILRGMLNQVMDDLNRPHEFAFERVGFLRCSSDLGGKLIFAETYQPIDDEEYIRDDFVGARFSGKVIENELNCSLKTGSSIFHVHKHEHIGEPALSNVDTKSIGEICQSLINVCADVPHGCILLSEDSVKAYVFSDRRNRLLPVNTLITGFPMSFEIYGGERNEK